MADTGDKCPYCYGPLWRVASPTGKRGWAMSDLLQQHRSAMAAVASGLTVQQPEGAAILAAASMYMAEQARKIERLRGYEQGCVSMAARIVEIEAERDALRAECERLMGGQGAAREAFLNLVADAEQFDENYDGDVDSAGRWITTLDYSLTRFPAEPLADLCAALGISQNRNETLKDAIERTIAEPVMVQP